MTEQQPSIGRVVHYVSRGSADGQFPSVCRAAIITEVLTNEGAVLAALDDVASDTVALCVLNPTGQFFDQHVQYADTTGTPADPDCPGLHEQGPHRYCDSGCEWTEPTLRGGTWHWPERV